MSTQAQANPFFVPTQVPGCQLWLDAADRSTLTLSGSNVTQWNDKSGNGYNLSQANASLQPAFVTNQLNGFGGVQPSSGKYLALIGTSMPNFAYGNQTSVFCVAKNGPTNSNWNIFATMFFTTIPTQTTKSRWHLSFNQGATAGFTLVFTNNPQIIYQNTSFVTQPSASAILGFTGSSSETVLAYNGLTSTYAGRTLQNADDGIVMAIADPRADAPVAGTVFEFIGFNRAITTQERQQIEGYLAWKWGLQSSLPATHPYKNSVIPPLLNPPTTLPLVRQNPISFVPTQISGCQLWLDGADSSTVTLSGTTVTQWRDKSGLANNTTGGAGTTSFTQTAVNGLSALTFNSSYFTGPFATAYTGNLVQAFAVASMSSSSLSYTRILSLGRPGVHDFNTTDSTFMMCRNTGQNIMIGRNGSYLTIDIPAYNTPFLVQSAHVGPIESIGVNGTLTPASQNTGVNGNFNLTSYGLGTNVNTTDTAGYWSGFICEVIYYTGTLTTLQRQQVEGYLAWKWGLQANLPSTHPYKQGSPAASSAQFPSRSIATFARFGPLAVPGCQLWLDAADPQSFTLSGASRTTVSAWNNKVPGGITTTTVSAPSLSGKFSNKIQTFRFNSNSITATLSSAVGTGDYALFALWLTINGGTEGVFSIGPNGGPAAGIGYNGSYYNLYEWGQSDSQYVAARNQYVVQSGTRISATKTVYYNGNAAASASGAQNLTNTTLYIGNGTGFPINGEIGEIIMYQGTLTTVQRQQVEGYLAWKWGLQGSLPATHPYKRWPPPPS